MSAETIVRHCAPTLAGLKVGNLFAYQYTTKADLAQVVWAKNHLLNPKGVYFVILKVEDGTTLILVYRRKALEQIVGQESVQAFLEGFGYTQFEVDVCIQTLQQHLQCCDFPHEIGVFLGYPLEDVEAFIQNKGANSKCVGCWKVYTNVCDAQRTFRLYKKCTSIYSKKLAEGFDLTRLTVASL